MEAIRKQIHVGDTIVFHTVTEALESIDVNGVVTSHGQSSSRLFLRRIVEDDPTTQYGIYSSAFEIVDPTYARQDGDGSGDGPQQLLFDGTINDPPVMRYGSRVCFRHRQSGLFLAIFPTQQSDNDESFQSARLVREEHMGVASFFKILPRFRIHYEGDEICDQDHIQIQLFDRPLFLHALPLPSEGAGGVADAELIEVNGSIQTPTILCIRRFIDVQEDGSSLLYATATARAITDARTICCGAGFVLFHRQKESVFLSRETSRCLKKKVSGTESLSEAHRAALASPQPLLERFSYLKDETSVALCTSPPSGALWALEPYNTLSGGSVKVRQLYRFRQVVTGKYLAVDGVSSGSACFMRFIALLMGSRADGIAPDQVDWCQHAAIAATLDQTGQFELSFSIVDPPTTTEEDVATLFLLRRTEGSTETGTEVTSKNLIRLQHACTGLWLGTGASSEFLDWCTLQLHRRPTLHDAMTLVPATPEVERNAAYVSAIREEIEQYVNFFTALNRSSQLHAEENAFSTNCIPRLITQTISAVTQVVCFCTKSAEEDPLKREGLPIHDHQQLLFDMDFHELLFRVVLCPFTTDLTATSDCTGGVLSMPDLVSNPQLGDVKHICRLAYRALRQMVKGNPALAARLTSWIPIMQRHSGFQLHVADTLLVVFLDNAELPRDICHDAITHYVKSLQSSRSAGYVKFLAVMCTAFGAGLLSNQEQICEELLIKSPQVLLRTMILSNGTIGLKLAPDSVVSLEEFLSSDSQPRAQAQKNAKLLKFFTAQIEFFCALSTGQRAAATVVSAIEQYIPKQHMIAIVETIISQVPPSGVPSHLDGISSHMIDLAKNLYVKEEQFVEGRHVGSEIGMVPECKRPIFPDDTPLVRSLKEVAFKILRTNDFLVVENAKRSQVIVSLLSFWELLVKRRHYYPTEAKQLFPILLGILDSSGDVLSPKKTRLGKEWNLYEANELNLAAMAVKEHACRVLDALLHNSIVDASMRVATALHEKYAALLDEMSLPPEAMKEVISMVAIESAAVAKEVSARKVVDRVHDVLRYESQSLTAIALSLVRRVSRTENEIAEHVRRFGFFQLEGITGQFFSGVRVIATSAFASNILRSSKEAAAASSNGSMTELVRQGSAVINFVLTTGRCPWDPTVVLPTGSTSDPSQSFAELFRQVQRERGGAEGVGGYSGMLSPTVSQQPVKLTLAALELHDNTSSRGKAAVASAASPAQPMEEPAGAAPPEELSPPVLLRAAVMQHWGITAHILPWLDFVTDVRSKAFAELVEVVYTLASGTVEAALVVAPHVHYFMNGIRLLQAEPRSFPRVRCIQIVMAIMSACKYAYGAVDRKLLELVFERIKYQAAQSRPNDTFLRLFNETSVGTHMAPHNQKYVLETLHAEGAFHLCSNITDKTNQQQLEFNASLLKLIANCCIGNSVARHVGHRILSAQTILDLLLSPVGVPTLHRASYYRLLGMLYFVFDDESPHERKQTRFAWTVNPGLWQLFATKVVPRLERIATRFRSREPEDQAESTLVFSSILPTLCCYFRDVFDVAGGNTVETVCSGVEQVAQAVAELAGAVFDASRKRSAAIGTKELTPLGTLLPLLRTVADELDLTSTAKQLSELVPGIEAEIQNALEGSCNESVMTGLEPDSAASHLRRIKKRLEMISKGSSTANSAELLGDAEDPRRIVVERFMRPDADAVFDKMIHSVSGERDAEGDKFCLALLDVVRATLNRAAEEGDEALERQQERFNRFGFIKITVEVTDSKDHNLFDAAIFSCIAAVEGGNHKVQDSLMEHFGRHNERFFMNLKNLLTVSLMNVRRENQQAAQLQLLGPGGDPLGAKLIEMCRDRRSPMYSLRHVDSILLLLQQLCEGHHHTLQNYIRFQSDNVVSTNMPKTVLDLFSECVVTVHKANVKVITRMLAFFTEICQGPCANNQMELVRGGICVHIARLLKLTAADVECHADDFDELHAAAAVTLLALLEGNETPEIFYRVLHEVPVGLIADLMGRLREHVPQSWTEGIDEGASEDAANLLFQFLIFLKQVRPHTATESTEREQIDAVFHEFHYLAVLLGRIEIQRGRSLERIYFKIPRLCLSLTEESREKLLWSVDRSTRHTKLSDFMAQADELIFEMEYAYNFRQRLRRLIGGERSSKLTAVQGGAGRKMMRHAQRMWSTVASYVLVPRVEYYENMILALAVMINLLFVLSDLKLDGVPESLQLWITPAAPNATDAEFAVLPNALSPFLADLPEATSVLHFQSESPSLLVSIFDSFAPIGFNDFVKIVAMMQVVLCAMALLMDSVMGLPLHFYRMDHKRDADAAEAKKRVGGTDVVVDHEEEDGKDTVKAPALARIRTCCSHLRTRVKDALLRVTTVYRMSLLVASLLAVFVTPLFLSLHLLGLINRSSILANVIIAITRNGKSLVVTMGLGVIIVYIFSVFGLSRFPEAYSPEDEGNCSSLQRCFIYILMNGLRQGGGIGDAMKGEGWDDKNHSIRMIHDFLFFSVMNIVFMNILFGIIIDTFAELRDDRQSKEEDMQTCCFVCGLQADSFEQAGISFEKHVAEDHDIFQYLFFIHHLRTKDKNDFNGQESYVFELIAANDLNFFPTKKCLAMVEASVDLSDSDGDECLDESGSSGRQVSGKGKGDGAVGGHGHSQLPQLDSRGIQRIIKLLQQQPAAAPSTAPKGAVSGTATPAIENSEERPSTKLLIERAELSTLIAKAVEASMAQCAKSVVAAAVTEMKPLTVAEASPTREATSAAAAHERGDKSLATFTSRRVAASPGKKEFGSSAAPGAPASKPRTQAAQAHRTRTPSPNSPPKAVTATATPPAVTAVTTTGASPLPPKEDVLHEWVRDLPAPPVDVPPPATGGEQAAAAAPEVDPYWHFGSGEPRHHDKDAAAMQPTAVSSTRNASSPSARHSLQRTVLKPPVGSLFPPNFDGK